MVPHSHLSIVSYKPVKGRDDHIPFTDLVTRKCELIFEDDRVFSFRTLRFGRELPAVEPLTI